jgi:hypothetical protein
MRMTDPRMCPASALFLVTVCGLMEVEAFRRGLTSSLDKATVWRREGGGEQQPTAIRARTMIVFLEHQCAGNMMMSPVLIAQRTCERVALGPRGKKTGEHRRYGRTVSLHRVTRVVGRAVRDGNAWCNGAAVSYYASNV